MLSVKYAERISQAIVLRISKLPLSLPLREEREPAFTARVLMPRVEEAVKFLDISGITVHGDGRAYPPSTVLPSGEFRPDIALLYRRERLAAFEVKFLRASGRQQALAAALGQAIIYISTGYQAVGTILVDLAPAPDEPKMIESIISKLGLQGCVLAKVGQLLTCSASK